MSVLESKIFTPRHILKKLEKNLDEFLTFREGPTFTSMEVIFGNLTEEVSKIYSNKNLEIFMFLLTIATLLLCGNNSRKMKFFCKSSLKWAPHSM